MGSDMLLEHPQNFPSLAPLLSDPNEPYYIPERGILFKDDRYLMSDPAFTNVWMLGHPHFFTILAWV